MKKYLLTLVFFLVSAGYAGENNKWQVSSPKEQQMSSKELIELMKYIRNNNFNIHSLLIIRNDHIVLDASFYPFQKGYVHDMASVTKSIMSLLTGIAIDKGFIQDENQKVIEFFPEYAVPENFNKDLSIKHLLNMTSGFECSWDNGERELDQMTNSTDWAGYMLNLRFTSRPGEKLSYCSGNYYLLAEIIQRSTKMKCHEFARKYLFDLLSMGKTYWQENSKGVNHGWGDLIISPHDLAKIGRLLLNEGKWNNRQIVSKGWLEKIKPLFKITDSEDYGYGWWFERSVPEKIEAIGRGGQRLVVLRDKKVIIVMTGGGYDSGDIDDYVLSSIEKYAGNTESSLELKAIINEVQQPGREQSGENLHKIPPKFLNTYIFEKNSEGLTSVSFSENTENQQYYFSFSFDDNSQEKHFFSTDNQYTTSKERHWGLPIALKGNFDGNDQVAIEYNELCRINLCQFTFIFSDDVIDFGIYDKTNNKKISLKGKKKEKSTL